MLLSNLYSVEIPESLDCDILPPSQDRTPSADLAAPLANESANMDTGDGFDDDFDIDDDQLMEVASAIKKEEKKK